MDQYICSICGYIYDEEKGIPEAGIAPATGFKDLPEDWACPLCGAPKSEFEKQGEKASPTQKNPLPAMKMPTDKKALSSLEMSVLCTNLARGCEKQYKPKEATLFNELAAYFKAASAPFEQPDMDELMTRIEKDLAEGFPSAHAAASEAQDRGALRALVWSEKVTRILKSLLARYQKEGEAMLQNTGVYVCTICGFVHIGDTLPAICPICKVPNWKFEEVEGR